MAIRPLDLQVSINSVIETSRDQAAKLATLMQEQRTIDGHMVDDAKHKSRIVNGTPKTDKLEKLDDTEKHFGNKTEAELEQEFADDDRKEKKTPDDEDQPIELKKKKQGPDEEHHVDTLA
jgi:hypothetical protein